MSKTPRLSLLGSRVSKAPPRLAQRPKVADSYYSTPEHRAWRLQVLERAGWRCEWIGDGERCAKSRATGHRMFADHVHERQDGGADHGLGMCLCGAHHTEKTIRERAKRMEKRWPGMGV